MEKRVRKFLSAIDDHRWHRIPPKGAGIQTIRLAYQRGYIGLRRASLVRPDGFFTVRQLGFSSITYLFGVRLLAFRITMKGHRALKKAAQ